MKQVDTQTVHHEIDTLNSRQLEEVGHFIGYLKSLPTTEQDTNLQTIKDRLKQSANSGEPISLDKAFSQIEALHQNRIR